jgi:nucleoside phosphorylase
LFLPRTLIIAASLGTELAGLQQEVEGKAYPKRDWPQVEFHLLGVGPERSGASTAQILASRRDVDGVLLLGIAGGLDPELETGSVVLAERYAMGPGADGDDPVLAADENMRRMAGQAAAGLGMPTCHGASVTVDHLVREPREREELRRIYDADSVNMEDYRAAAAAANAGVPFLSVRVVLDPASQRLPAYLEELSRAKYGIFTKVLAMPWRIPALWGLKNQLMLCRTVITRLGVAYLEQQSERMAAYQEQAAAQAPY